ncbi:MAG TPA: DUF308 domain-containing protein [Baekduia sp.]|uniref:DUF308 domain-containing protein n=1 Tax=Baekduia sp. TaxID=2600305 RepID=UPI002D76BFF4|nr:DUF308 domain-containing protein [Baekduia sp.]HET6510277.1 DUF308 domain-containing protein [Baekduia sp.]
MSAAYPSADPFGGVGDTPSGPPRWLAAIAGALSVVIGVAALIWPGPTLLAVGLLFGIYFTIWAVSALVRAIGAHELPVGLRLLDIIVSVIGLLLGLTLIVRPGASVATAALLLGFWWLFLGVMQLVHGVVDPAARVWNVIWGIIGAAAGIIILASPEIALGTLVLVVGISLIVQGLLELMVAFGGGR